MIKTKHDKLDYPLLFVCDNTSNKDIYQLALNEAYVAARFLKEKYSAKNVWIFGSLLDPQKFNKYSDIDLAVEGVPDNIFYSAVGELLKLTKNFDVDLVDVNDCKNSIAETIKKEGVKI